MTKDINIVRIWNKYEYLSTGKVLSTNKLGKQVGMGIRGTLKWNNQNMFQIFCELLTRTSCKKLKGKNYDLYDRADKFRININKLRMNANNWTIF